MSTSSSQGFGKFRSLFCPVHKSELKLFLPLVLIFFFICFNYNVLRPAKDSLVITAPSSGAEILPFIKLWVILPMALLMTLLFTRLTNRFSREKVFYIMMGIFLGFFILFAGVLYPLKDYLHPHEFADKLEAMLPVGCKGLVALFRNWTYTTFYVMAELWGTTIMTVLFWGFANEILSVHTAKRFYVLILVGGNLSAIGAGSLSSVISKLGIHWGSFHGADPWQYSLLVLTSVIIFNGFLIVGIFRWLHKNILTHQDFSHHLSPTSEEPNAKISLRTSFGYLAKSKYLLCIATIVLTYNICMNLTEVTWKDQLLQICPHPNDFNAYMGKVTMWIGIAATVVAIISATVIRKWSWTANALVPPVILLVAGIGFFSFLIFKNTSFGLTISLVLGSTPQMIGVFFGSLQHCFSRASKYTIFDATKELAFIPLSKESKLKGKAAIDGVGSRLGKSGAALIYQTLLIFLGTVGSTIPYVGIIFLFAIAAWMIAVISLGKRFNALVSHHETIALPEEEPAESRKPQEVAT